MEAWAIILFPHVNRPIKEPPFPILGFGRGDKELIECCFVVEERGGGERGRTERLDGRKNVETNEEAAPSSLPLLHSAHFDL